MEYKYTIEESDYLTHQLYSVSQSKPAIRRRRRGWAITTGFFFILALFYYAGSDTIPAYSFLLIGMLSLFLYPLYYRWRYKRHYRKYIREQFANNFGKSTSLSFEDDHILAKDDDSESKIGYAQIEIISKLPEHFLIRLKNGHAIIIPKSKVNYGEALEQELVRLADRLHLPLKDESHWKWR
ncbi:YcxB family protein [Catalinimonas niigatensis]|uniref:YcxB family protein n=1 Tax=Catalinimonas niigatensis TaxID=1397264 RepID=UPI0026670F52|nr:YcxB family protein [Catalinimonas niigatensis]WPP52683.1 YcxB family protein [Catalinimonas niigatensis]